MLAHNEAATIEAEVRAFYAAIVARIPGSEFIVAEDGSVDGTSEILSRLSEETGIIHFTGKVRKGYRQALVDAVLLARNPFVFFSDSGNKHDPEDFWKLYPLRGEYNLIVGRKTHRQDQRYRRALTQCYNWLLRQYFGLPGIRDADSGFRLFDRAVVEGIFKAKLEFHGFVGSEIVLRVLFSGMSYAEVPVSYRLREGVSRSLPPKRIPGEIARVLKSVRSLKAEFESARIADSV